MRSDTISSDRSETCRYRRDDRGRDALGKLRRRRRDQWTDPDLPASGGGSGIRRTLCRAVVLLDTSIGVHMLRPDGEPEVRDRVTAALVSGQACWCR